MAGSDVTCNFLGLLLIAGVAFSYPVEADSELIESTVREVRALPPPGFDLQAASTGGHHGGGGGGHDVGYLRTKNSKGDNGYQKFDSYHNKDGDAYGYESHSSFGKATGGQTGGSFHHSGSYKDGKSDGGHYEGAHSGASGDGGHAVGYEGGSGGGKDHEGAGTYSAALTDAEYFHGGHDGGSGEHHAEHYSGGDGGHHVGGGEHHSAHYTSGGGDYNGEYHH
jgi:hypothetical protein